MKGYVSVALVLMTSMSPTQNHVTPRFSMLTAGDEFTCGLTTDGAAWCWGANQNGQLGSRSTETCKGVMYVARGACSLRPARVSGGLRFRAIDAGSYHVCGLTDEGRAYCWGRNALGELGRSDIPRRCVQERFVEPCTDVPVPVETDLHFSAISAGDSFTCALTTDGVPYCWGVNKDGVYGAGNSTGGDPRVVRISALGTFVTLSSSGSQTCALTSGGTVSCWGAGLTAAARPIQLPGKAVTISRGWGHTCALLTDGTGWCWGENDSGELGVKPSDSTYRITVPLAQRAPKLDSLVAGFGGTCGIGHDHDLYCWGDGFTLGSRATEKCFHVDEWSGCSWAPARVALDSIVSVTMGFVHACALAQSGAAFCWGDNAAGALGNGSKRSSVEPRSVDMHLQ